MDWLEVALRPYGLDVTGLIRDRLLRYCAALFAWNTRYGLLSRQDVDNVLCKHVAASLGPLLLVSPGLDTEWVDVGTGAGLPGLILRIWCPQQQITLIDGSRKRCVFLEHMIRELGVGPLPVLPVRVETLVARSEMLGAFSILFSRAVTDVTSVLQNFGPLVRPGGAIITFKGPEWQQDVRAAQDAGLLGRESFAVVQAIRIPWAAGHLVQFQKVSA